MAVDSTTSSTSTPTLETLLQGANMGNLFGGNGNGSTTEGLVLGMLLGRNGMFGNNGVVDGAGGAMLRTPPEQATANMSLMAGIGDVKQAVAVSSVQAENSNATQSLGISNQVSGVAAAVTNTVTMAKDAAAANAVSLMQQLNTVNTNLMETKFELAQVVNNDGDKTRMAIASLAERLPSAREIDLERQLGVAQAANREATVLGAIRSGNVEVTNTISVNQQQQQQQQVINGLTGQLQQLLAEQRITQGILNIGSGSVSGNSQTAANTRVA